MDDEFDDIRAELRREQSEAIKDRRRRVAEDFEPWPLFYSRYIDPVKKEIEQRKQQRAFIPSLLQLFSLPRIAIAAVVVAACILIWPRTESGDARILMASAKLEGTRTPAQTGIPLLTEAIGAQLNLESEPPQLTISCAAVSYSAALEPIAASVSNERKFAFRIQGTTDTGKDFELMSAVLTILLKNSVPGIPAPDQVQSAQIDADVIVDGNRLNERLVRRFQLP